MRALVLAALIPACAGGVPPPSSCPGPDGSTIQLIGVGAECSDVAGVVTRYRDLEAATWGPIPLAGWTVQVVSVADAPVVNGVARYGATYHLVHKVVVVLDRLDVLPHELHHVALGPDSDGHSGWCSFGAWEFEVLGFDERAYLGCAQ